MTISELTPYAWYGGMAIAVMVFYLVISKKETE
jgi:hypothetical protein